MYKLIKELFSLLTHQQRRKFYILQVLVVLVAIAEVASLAAIGPFMALVGNLELIETNQFIHDFYIESGVNDPISFLFIIGLLVLLILILSAVLSTFTIWKLSFFAARTGAEIGDSLYEYYLRENILFHSVTTSSQLTKQIATEVARVTDHILQPCVQINARIVAVLFISIAIFIYDPVISMVSLSMFLIIYYVLFISVRNRLERNGSVISKVSRERFTLMNEGFGAIKEIKLLGREKSFINSFKASGEAFSEAYGSSNGLYNMPRYLMELIIYSGVIVLILILLKKYNGELSQILPVLAVFGLASFKLLPSFQQIYSGMAQIKSNISALEAIKDDILLSRVVNKDALKNACNIGYGEYIELEEVSFKYPNKSNYALDGITLKIPFKGVVGIVGPSGSGKSTLLDVLLGLISPSQGNVFIGGKKLDINNLRNWQDRIGYVPQNVFLSEGSVIENVAFGIEKDSIDFEKVKKAVEMAHLKQWVNDLDDGYLTKIGERGVQISGGQRQRLGIARALYNDAEVLFFDEATSALDGITENIIMEAIESIGSKKTIIMIAHRLNTVKNCDLIFMIEQGRLVDQGSYQHLMENNPHFQRMALGK